MIVSIYLLASFFVDTHALPARRAIPPAPVTACAAVTQAEIEQALDTSVAAGAEETDGPESNCNYAGPGRLVTVSIRRTSAKLDLSAEIASLKQAIPEGIVRNAPGIGTRAFFMDIAGAGVQLHVIRGERDAVMISILGFGEASQVSAAAEGLARKALARM